jgi:hypothetical protein
MPTPPTAAAAEGLPSDPVLELIKSFRSSLATFSAGTYETDEETHAAVGETFGPKLEAIEQMTIGATSLEGAIEAVRMAYEGASESMCDPSISSAPEGCSRVLGSDQTRRSAMTATTRRSILGIALTAPIAVASNIQPADTRDNVEVAAAALAEAMKATHGGTWSVQVSHDSTFVAVSKDLA